MAYAGDMNRLAILAALILVAAKAPPASQDEKDQAMRAHFACLYAAVPDRDDGVSDARTVGKSVALACRDTLATLASTLARGKGKMVESKLFDRLIGHEADEGADAVLAYRVRQKKPTES